MLLKLMELCFPNVAQDKAGKDVFEVDNKLVFKKGKQMMILKFVPQMGNVWYSVILLFFAFGFLRHSDYCYIYIVRFISI